MIKAVLFVGAVSLAKMAFPGGETGCPSPVLQFRLRAPDVASDDAWSATREMIASNPGCCDEVWFSTGMGVPPVAVHADRAARMVRAAEDLRRLGIVPSLQFHATIGHGDAIALTEDCSAKTWTGWTGSTGVECKTCNCPRQPGFLEYVRTVARHYSIFRPAYVWIDDDLRVDNHRPATDGSRPGCWCERCIADFNVSTGGKWTRETLDAAVEGNQALMKAWLDFSDASLAEVARAIADEFRARSPGTKMALQHGMRTVSTIRRILETLHVASGKSIGFRPGAGAYYDVNPNDQVLKSLSSARFRRTLEDMGCISVWTPEIESWPRVYGSRSAQSILVEGFTALMYGMDAVSMFVTQTGGEDRSLYSRTILGPVAQGAPVLKGYAVANRGTVPVGFSSDLPVAKLYGFAATGVPVLFGIGRACGTVGDGEAAFNRCRETSVRVQSMRESLDSRAGGAPVLVCSPFVGLVLPRVSVGDGALRTVALVNIRIDGQGPVSLVLRGVPDGAKAVWRELRRAPVEVPLCWDGGSVRATVPSIGAWNGGYLDLCKGNCK